MQDGSFLRMNFKVTHKWTWPALRDQYRKYTTPYNWQNIKGELQVY